MSKQKPSIPKGMRDFGPNIMVRRNYLLETIKRTFQKFGFLPLETPTMENLSVLTGKYGNEGDQLLFKVLNSGDFLKKAKGLTEEITSKELTPTIADKGLRYDLTVPFARYVVMNQNDIVFPFRRYQVQPVWRADRPQKGRYREFYQCDADVVGTNSLLCESEIIMMLNEIFKNLKLDGYAITINNRKILTGITESIGEPGRESDLCVAIDKIDKIGIDKVKEELIGRQFSENSILNLEPFLNLVGSNKEKLVSLASLLSKSSIGLEGIAEIKEIFDHVESMGGNLETVDFDPSLARGLSYYTGAIFEVKMLDGSIGSISGGGRYDNLTGVFGLPDVSGVGISLGVDRIYDVLEARKLFPENNLVTSKILILNFGGDSFQYALKQLALLRKKEINAEMYPHDAKLKKQMTYADNRKIPYTMMIGSNEMDNNTVTIKNMMSGIQNEMSIEEAIRIINIEADKN